jgi:hypothetical protein
MSAKRNVQTTLTCDVEGCPHHLTLAGEPDDARDTAISRGWTGSSGYDWCPNHPDVTDG